MLPFLAAAIPLITKVLDRVIPDTAARDQAKAELEQGLLTAMIQSGIAQQEVNKAEAQHASLFVAGWRPAVGWTCALGFFWTFVGHPVATWAMLLLGRPEQLPVIDHEILMELVFGLLGMAGLRTFEKFRGRK